ncbi:hypothetical protein ACHAWC_010604 [Mediolabrus comicus]
MKNPIRVPLRSLNRKKEREKEKVQINKINPSTSACDSTLTLTKSYSSSTSTLATNTTTPLQQGSVQKKKEPPGWVHNKPQTIDEENADSSNHLKENTPPTRRCHQQQLHMIRQNHVGVPSPVLIRSPLPSQHMSHRKDNNDIIQMSYSESTCSESGSILSNPLCGSTAYGSKEDANDEQEINFDKIKCAEEMVQQMNKKMKSKNWKINFELCDDGNGQQSLRKVPSTISSKGTDIENQVSLLDDLLSPPAAAEHEVSSPFSSPPQSPSVMVDDEKNFQMECAPQLDVNGGHTAPLPLLNMDRMSDIYSAMMLNFKAKIISELREEMKKECDQQLFALKSELGEMNQRLINLEEQQKAASTLQCSSATTEETILKKVTSKLSMQQKEMEAMLDAKLANAMAGANVELNLAVHEVKKEGERLSKLALREQENSIPSPKHQTSKKHRETWNLRTAEELDCENARINESFAEAMQTIDDFMYDCDNLANEFDSIAFRMEADSSP